MKKRIKIQGALIFLAVVVFAAFAGYLLPDSQSGLSRQIADGAGAALFLLGYALRIMARGYKSELNPDGKSLVTSGPYALTRNPMYLGTLLIGMGVILLLLKWWAGLIFLAVYLAIYLPQISKEEKKLRIFFGVEFRDYCRKTPRFFPGVKSFLRKDKQSRLQLKSAWIKKEANSFIPTSIFVAFVKIWEMLCR